MGNLIHVNKQTNKQTTKIIMSRHKVSRGNTSDLIGMFNKKSTIEAPSSGDVGGLLSVNPGSLGVSHKFRKTSAFVPSTTKIEDKVAKPEVVPRTDCPRKFKLINCTNATNYYTLLGYFTYYLLICRM